MPRISQSYFPNGTKYAANELASQSVKWVLDAGKDGGVLGLSGGIDSSSVAVSCADGFMNAKKKLVCALMPSVANSPDDLSDAKEVVQFLRQRYETEIIEKVVQIQGMVDGCIAAMPDVFEGCDPEDNFDIGSLYSECRAVVLSRLAAKHNCLVMGTGNYDEDYVLGYFNVRGDGAVDNNLLGALPKELVREIARFYGLPSHLVERVPTAGLRVGQTDEGELGFSYKVANRVIRGIQNHSLTPEAVAEEVGCGIDIVFKVLKQHESTEHKRKLPPIGLVHMDHR